MTHMSPVSSDYNKRVFAGRKYSEHEKRTEYEKKKRDQEERVTREKCAKHTVTLFNIRASPQWPHSNNNLWERRKNISAPIWRKPPVRPPTKAASVCRLPVVAVHRHRTAAATCFVYAVLLYSRVSDINSIHLCSQFACLRNNSEKEKEQKRINARQEN